MMTRRVSAGSITSSISKCDAVLSALPCSYMRATISLERARGAPRGRRCAAELVAEAELHRALEAHAAELAGRPGDREERRLEAAAGHRLRAEAVAPCAGRSVKNGTVRLAPMTNRRLQWRTSAVFSTSGPTMMPGVSQRKRIGMSKASQSCMKRAALSAPSLSMAPARCVGLLAMTPSGRPSMRTSAVTMPAPKSRRSSSTEPVSASVVDHRAHVVDAQPVLRDDARAGAAGRRTSQSASGALEVRQVLLGDARPPRPRRRPRRRRRRSAPARSSGRPPRAGRRRARRPRSSPARPCRCSSSRVAMTTSQQPSSAALPAKQRPELMPTSGTSPREPPEVVEREAVEAGDADAVGVAGPAAAALGEEHDRQPPAARRARTCGPSCGGSACPACRRARCSRTTAPRSATRSRPNSVAVHACRCRRPARRPASSRSGPRACGAAAARRSRARRTRRSCPGRRGRRRSRAPCAGRSCAAARPRRAARRRASMRVPRAAPRRGRAGCGRGRSPRRRRSAAGSTVVSSMKTSGVALEHGVAGARRRSRGRRRRAAPRPRAPSSSPP